VLAVRRIDLAAVAIATALTWAIVETRDSSPPPVASAPLRIASFNIEMFPNERTDPARVVESLVELDADAIALQEIRDAEELRAVLDEVSRRTSRSYRLRTTRCGGEGEWFTTAIAWDADRLRAIEVRDYPGLDPERRKDCDMLTQAGLLVVFEDDERERVALLSVHLSAHTHNFDARKQQWPRVLAILAAARAEYGAEALALGDFNSTGFLGEPATEREFVEQLVERAGHRLLSGQLPCTEYWRRDTVLGPFTPSLLDHAVATDAGWSGARVEGYCARLACAVAEPAEMDPDHFAVSDHCPIVIERARQ
jgi:endonuclease/exonuclease/phosphatase family metal-dependent hydrolase